MPFDGQERARERCAQRAVRDVEAALAHRVHGNGSLDQVQLVGGQLPHVLARAGHAEAEERQGNEKQRETADGVGAVRPGHVGECQAHAQRHLRREADQAALLRAGQEVRVRERRPPRSAQRRHQVLLDDLLAGGVVVGAGAAPRVVVRHQHQSLGTFAGHCERVVEAGGAPREGTEPLAPHHHDRVVAGGRRGALREDAAGELLLEPGRRIPRPCARWLRPRSLPAGAPSPAARRPTARRRARRRSDPTSAGSPAATARRDPSRAPSLARSPPRAQPSRLRAMSRSANHAKNA